jgi:class 3 adenylate cyclase
VLTGPTFAIATAMEQNAPAQEVLLAESTFSVVRSSVDAEPRPPVQPKGRSEQVANYRLISVAERAAESAEGGEPAGRGCRTCGADNGEDDRYCATCGSQLAEQRRISDTRKTVTVVFADPKPTTATGAPPPPEAMRDVMSRYFAAMRQALERHGATVEKFIGDAVMAVFGLPVRHEDDALRAVRASLDMQAALEPLNASFEAEYGITLQNHIGVNTGEVVAGDASLGQRLVTGDVVNIAARLEQAAGSREVLLGDLTHRLVRDAVVVEAVPPLTLKGKSEPVPAHRLLSVQEIGEAVQRRQDTAMVGREAEMASLHDVITDAITARACRMATVVGDAGVGKSRLVREFTASAGDATVIRGRCLPYGDGITFWPLREAVRELCGIGNDEGQHESMARLREHVADSAVVDRLASVIGLSQDPFPVPEIFWGVRKFLEGIARDRAVVLVIDDIHWAEQTFLELIGHLVEAVEDAPVLLLCSTRHELLEKQPDWATTPGSLRLVLTPLTDADAARVVDGLLGGTDIDADVRGRIIQGASGNPLFVEQLLSMLIDEGTLRRDDDRWVAVGDLSGLKVPPTIEALLAARLDMLERDEREVIEPAAVVGQNFPVGAVEELVPKPISPAVPAHLQALAGKQLVQPQQAADEADAAYRFHHLLVRDAAYNGLLKRARADLHERFVTWAEQFNAAHDVDNREFEEIHGYHLEQAFGYLKELGTLDDHARSVGNRASEKLASAGDRAMLRGDLPAAANLLRRATSTRDRLDGQRLRLLPALGEALTELGEFDEVRQVVGDATDAAEEAGDQLVAAHARLVQLYAELYSGAAEEGQDWSTEVDSVSLAAIPLFEAADYEAGLTFAWRMRVGMFGAAQRSGDVAVAAEQVIEHARRSGNARAEVKASFAYATAALYGPTPVEAAIARIEEIIGRVTGDQYAMAYLGLILAQLHAMGGDFARGREGYLRAASKLRELRAGIYASSTSLAGARVETLAGDLTTAEAYLRNDYEALEQIGEKYFRASIAAVLTRTVVAQGRVGEAEEIAQVAEEIAAPDDVDAQSILRGAKARILAEHGRHAEAVALAGEAVHLREQGDLLVDRAEAYMDLADVHALCGDPKAAEAALTEAHALASAKGDVATLRRIEAARGQLETKGRRSEAPTPSATGG